MLTSELFSPIFDAVKSNVLLMIPIGIGLFALGMAIVIIPTAIKLFVMPTSSGSSSILSNDDYFEPYIIEEGDISDLDESEYWEYGIIDFDASIPDIDSDNFFDDGDGGDWRD